MSILFCTPCYGGQLVEAHFKSCLNLKEELTNQGLAHDWLTGRNESLVHRARMEMTASFLKSPHTHMMWLDADIEFEPSHVAALWNMQVDIAVGVYRMKKIDDLYAAWVDGKLVTDLAAFEGPTQVDYAGTGFMLISRSAVLRVYEYLKDRERTARKLFDRLPHAELTEAEAVVAAEMLGMVRPDYEGAHGTVPALYMTPIFNHGLESEDFHFSRIARAAGLQVIMDPSVKLVHWGQYAYGA